MAIAEMSRMTLVGLKSDKNEILDALQRTGAAQITPSEEYELAPHGENGEGVAKENALVLRAEHVLEYLAKELDDAPKALRGDGVAKDGIGVTSQQFFAVGDAQEEYEKILSDVEKIEADRNENNSALSAVQAERKTYADYECVPDSFAAFCDTECAAVYLGVIPFDKTAAFSEHMNELDTAAFRILGNASRGEVVCVVAYKPERDKAETVMSSCGFTRCPVKDDVIAKEKLRELDEKEESLKQMGENITARACEAATFTEKIKIYVDYHNFLKEKYSLDEAFAATDSAFVLSAYVPTEATERIKAAVNQASRANYICFEQIKRDEFAPTLMKNKKAVANFESVTNMYSVPAYGALDPNGVMGFFFSLFMGVIMADVGYGLMMIVGGFLFVKKQREGTTVNRMAKVFAIGGFFAVAFGLLLDSFLGLSLFRGSEGYYGSILPASIAGKYAEWYAEFIDPVAANVRLMGIDIPSMLLWCLGLGTIHIAVSLIMKAVQCFKRGQIVDGIFGGIVWSLALISLVVWVFCMCAEISPVTTYAMYATVGCAGLGVLTAGITEKGAWKFIKMFTSAYGLINYASDILSYARLYGLMLSGAQIASIFTNTLAIQMLFPSGVAGIIFGVIVIIIGNVFNVAMSLLGAFIHDSRLQYVEFFGRFYEGEGELFTPFGRSYEHIYFKN